MGALHRGHAALLQRARILAGPGGTVIVSIFVNPTQFGPKEDLSRYPRPFAADRALCRQEGVDLIFHPEPGEMYAPDASTWVNEESVSQFLCGASRPGHFRGVCTVVLKLFNITRADIAVFGRKDFQQCMVIQRMVRDLNVSNLTLLTVALGGCGRTVSSPWARRQDGRGVVGLGATWPTRSRRWRQMTCSRSLPDGHLRQPAQRT